MINEIKLVLLKPYNEKMDEYKAYRGELADLENQLLYDDCDKQYQSSLKDLKDKYKKSKDKEAYEEELRQIQIDYRKKLDLFHFNKEKYDLMKQRVANYNVYEMQQKMEKINGAKTIEDLELTVEEVQKICEENGIEFKLPNE